MFKPLTLRATHVAILGVEVLGVILRSETAWLKDNECARTNSAANASPVIIIFSDDFSVAFSILLLGQMLPNSLLTRLRAL